MTDEEIDTSDTSPLDDAFFDGARLRMPRKVSIILKLMRMCLNGSKRRGKISEIVLMPH